jgi:hypothetical protein
MFRAISSEGTILAARSSLTAHYCRWNTVAGNLAAWRTNAQRHLAVSRSLLRQIIDIPDGGRA